MLFLVKSFPGSEILTIFAHYSLSNYYLNTFLTMKNIPFLGTKSRHISYLRSTVLFLLLKFLFYRPQPSCCDMQICCNHRCILVCPENLEYYMNTNALRNLYLIGLSLWYSNLILVFNSVIFTGISMSFSLNVCMVTLAISVFLNSFCFASNSMT